MTLLLPLGEQDWHSEVLNLPSVTLRKFEC
jgi:hypothetical protein